MLAKSDKYIQEAADSIYELTQDEKIRLQCEAREDYHRRTIDMNHKVAKAQAEKQQAIEELQRLRQLLHEHGIDTEQSD